LLGQYTDFDSERQRVLFLERLLTTMFVRLLTVDFPDPWDLDEVFADVVAEDRLMIASVDVEEQMLLEDLGVGGGFPVADGDVIGVMTQNAGHNKIDSFLSRSVDYRARLDPDTRTIEADVTIELTNLVTSLDLPDAVVENNDQGYPRGTNVLELTVYSPHTLVVATIDGEVGAFRATPEFGIRGYSVLLEIPADSTVVVAMSFEGTLDLSNDYVLTVPVQPAASPDTFEFDVSVPSGVTIAETSGSWRQRLSTSADQQIQLSLRRAE
jgi:hypothetical protein